MLVGSPYVGKTCLLNKYSDGSFQPFETIKLVVFKLKFIEIDSKKVKMVIWDVPSTSFFDRSCRGSYLKRIQGILLLYDVTDRETFENLKDWLIEIVDNCKKNVLKILIGNKCDLERDRKITTKEGLDFAYKYGMKFLEMSAQNDINVSEAFELLVTLLIENSNDSK